jgi:Tol biopolymer transport system component
MKMMHHSSCILLIVSCILMQCAENNFVGIESLQVTCILFTSEENLYTIRHDGTDMRLVEGTEGAVMGRWSPDAQHIAFIRHEPASIGETTQIWIIDSDGKNPQQLSTEPGRKNSPSWSPDGTMIAFDQDGDVYILDTITGIVHNFTQNPEFHNADPAWSPTGRYMAYYSWGAAELGILHGLYLSTINGYTMGDVTGRWFVTHMPAWSPDGTTVASVKDIGYILTLNVNTLETHRIDQFSAHFQIWNRPSYSPDGLHFVIEGEDYTQTHTDKYTDLYIIDDAQEILGDDHNVQRITDLGTAKAPDWSPFLLPF